MKEWRRPKRPSPALVVALIALVLAAGGVAVASIPGPTGAIAGCFNPSSTNKELSVVDHDASCPGGNVRLVWNQKGPTGATGATGPKGVAAYQVRVQETKKFSGDRGSKTVLCTGGREVLGGGASIHGFPEKNFALKVNRPRKRLGTKAARWTAVGVRRGGSNGKWFLRVTVICAKVG